MPCNQKIASTVDLSKADRELLVKAITEDLGLPGRSVSTAA